MAASLVPTEFRNDILKLANLFHKMAKYNIFIELVRNVQHARKFSLAFHP